MADEARQLWEVFITAPENARLLTRYAKSAKEPAPLFDSIGEDLGSSKQHIREQAYWALVAAMPKLASILYTWETRQPRWRGRKGKDQQMVNQGADMVSYLHRKLVLERRFKIGGKYGKDPRPFVNEAIENKGTDEWRKSKREVQLDHGATLMIPDPTPSLEDRVVENDAYEGWKREFRRYLYSDDELEWFITVTLDETTLVEVLNSNGVDPDSAPTVRQHFSRARKEMISERDAVLTFLLFNRQFGYKGKIPRFPKDLQMSEIWVELSKHSVRPGEWRRGKLVGGCNWEVALRPLTTDFSGAPAHIYLAAIQNDYKNYEQAFCWHPPRDPAQEDFIGKNYTVLIDAIINSASRLSDFEQVRNHYKVLWLNNCSTELPGINDALNEVPDDYDAWLICNSLQLNLNFPELAR